MTAALIDGKAIAKQIRLDIAEKIKEAAERNEKVPFLAVILVGENPASQVYVSHKERACQSVGMESVTIILPKDSTQEQVEQEILKLNGDDKVDGILLQLPLPSHLKKESLIEMIDPDKDVDGLTPINQGRLCWREPGLYPCTPLGVMELIRSTGMSLSGKVAAVVGRSTLVGMPVGILLEIAGCTVLGLHSESVDIGAWTKQADLIVVATGVPQLVKKDWVKPGAVVIDVGISRVGNKLVGDVDFEDVKDVAGQITPVPGGVGPMTIAMLLSNCLKASKLRASRKSK